jgi:lycopene beta-cyclase
MSAHMTRTDETTTDWDVVIVGGGLSGLSLAVELAQPEHAHLRVLVLEKRSQYLRDRTWSYWATRPHRYTALERKRWNAWRVSFGGQHAVQQTASSAGLAYCTMDADAFYDFAQAQINAAPHVHLQMGMSVSDVRDGPVQTVVLADGTSLRSTWVMDGRPLSQPKAHSLCQHFMGWEIETPADCFDDSTVELMDFQPASQGLHFLYVLPYGPRQALIESTWMSPYAHQPDYEVELKAYLQSRYGLAAYKRVYQEQGCLDLQATPRTYAVTDGTYKRVSLGRAAGTLRSSTGFAFLETIADAKRIAQCFANVPLAAVRVPPYRSDWLDMWMDKIFCDGLMADWPRAPEFFLAMFKGVAANTLVAFLTGRPSLMQRLQVSLQLPKWHFLRAARRVLTG